jgi:hypothetical protein
MADKSVVLKALEAYQTKLQREYSKVDALLHGDFLRPLMDVREEFHGLVNTGKHDKKTLDRMSELAAKEKKLHADFKKSCAMKTTDRWIKLSAELDELNNAIFMRERQERRG